MRPFFENFPFFSIFLAIIAGIVSAVIRSGKAAFRLTLIVCALVALLSAGVLIYTLQNDCSFAYTMGRFLAPYGNAIKAGPLQALMGIVFSCVMGLSLLGGEKDLFHDILPAKQPFYFVMINLLLASLLSLTYTNDVFTGYVFIEISTIAACAMVMAKDTGPNLISTIRYLFMSLLGSGLVLIGLTFLNSVTGYLLMPSLHDAVGKLAASGEYHIPLTVSIGLLIVGLGVKSAMFPFHLWLPDAHGGATTASSAILSGLVLKGYIMFMLLLIVRVFTVDFIVELGINRIILLFGLLGMIVGSLSALREHHVKRMLAYSSVAQIGYIFLGIGMGTEAGLMAACYHILVHACCKPLLFCCAGRLSAVSGHHRSLRNLRGSAYRDKVAGLGLAVGAMSMIGIPLFGGFASKLYLATAALESEWMPAILLTIALSTVLNALYYVPAVLAVWEKPSPDDEAAILADTDEGELAPNRPFTAAAILLIAAVLALGICVHPIRELLLAGIRLI